MKTTTEENRLLDAVRRENLLHAIDAFICQRPGLDFANYGDVAAYRSEYRGILRDKHVAERLLGAVSWRRISADALLDAARNAYSGRMSITETSPGAFRIDYCTGQYFPTEYRAAACAVLASALWNHVREECMPEGTKHGATEAALTYLDSRSRKFVSAGEWLRRYFRREFGASVARVWFN